MNYYSMDYEKLTPLQKAHYKRYEFAAAQIENDVVADLACGTGYGSLMLSKKCKSVTGHDIDVRTIKAIRKRYVRESNVFFEAKNLLNISCKNIFDKIISFETIEHFTPDEISIVLSLFHEALKDGGKLIFSTPYDQKETVLSMRHHKTFNIVEATLKDYLDGLFEIEKFYFQDKDTYDVKNDEGVKDYIICIAKKISARR